MQGRCALAPSTTAPATTVHVPTTTTPPTTEEKSTTTEEKSTEPADGYLCLTDPNCRECGDAHTCALCGHSKDGKHSTHVYLQNGRCVAAVDCIASGLLPVGDRVFGRVCLGKDETCSLATGCNADSRTAGHNCLKSSFVEEGTDKNRVMRCLECPSTKILVAPGRCVSKRKCSFESNIGQEGSAYVYDDVLRAAQRYAKDPARYTRVEVTTKSLCSCQSLANCQRCEDYKFKGLDAKRCTRCEKGFYLHEGKCLAEAAAAAADKASSTMVIYPYGRDKTVELGFDCVWGRKSTTGAACKCPAEFRYSEMKGSQVAVCRYENNADGSTKHTIVACADKLYLHANACIKKCPGESYTNYGYKSSGRACVKPFTCASGKPQINGQPCQCGKNVAACAWTENNDPALHRQDTRKNVAPIMQCAPGFAFSTSSDGQACV